MSEYDLDLEDDEDYKGKSDMVILIKKIGNGFIVNFGYGYNYYETCNDIIKETETFFKAKFKLKM